MKILHELLVDDHSEGTGVQASNGFWMPALGCLDTVRFIIVADLVSGTSPTLFVEVNEAPDLTNIQTTITTLVPSSPLVVGQPNVFSGSMTEVTPGSYGYQLFWVLGGSSPKAHLRIWATGRGRA